MCERSERRQGLGATRARATASAEPQEARFDAGARLRAELELSDARAPVPELELTGARHRAELESFEVVPLGPSRSCVTDRRAPSGRRRGSGLPNWRRANSDELDGHSRRRSRRAPRCLYGWAPRAILARLHRGRDGRRNHGCPLRATGPIWARILAAQPGRRDDWRRAAILLYSRPQSARKLRFAWQIRTS